MQRLGLGQHQAQVRQFLLEPLGILPEALPGGDEFREQAVIAAARPVSVPLRTRSLAEASPI